MRPPWLIFSAGAGYQIWSIQERVAHVLWALICQDKVWHMRLRTKQCLSTPSFSCLVPFLELRAFRQRSELPLFLFHELRGHRSLVEF